MPSFFMKPGARVKRKKIGQKQKSVGVKKKGLPENISDIDDDESVVSGDANSGVESESDKETAQEKKLRLAKEYISKLELLEKEKQLDDEIDHDAIAHRLQEDVLEDAGRLQKFIADEVIEPDVTKFTALKGHKLSVTCVIVSSDGQFIFSASKDGAIYKWSSASGLKLGKIPGLSKSEKSSEKGHRGQVLCMALSTDVRYLASAGHDEVINIWNPTTLAWLHTFSGHRKMISSLAFRSGKNELFSASHDKTVKVWSLDEMAYVETLFGHEDAVLGAASLMRDRVLTCGGRDRSLRLWKIPEESQLVFQTNVGSSIDCVAMLNEDYFISGGDDGSLSIWFVRKKKPITLRTKAHATCTPATRVCTDTWITSVASLPFTDLVASGSCDGCIRFWKCEKSFRSLMPLFSIPMAGFVNSLAISPGGDFLVAGIGQEHRLGRWWKETTARNLVYIIPLRRKHVENIPVVKNAESEGNEM